MVDFDMSEVRTLAADLGRVPGRIVPELDATTKKAAQAIKDELNDALKASRHFKRASGSVTYDPASHPGHIGYEVGPDKSKVLPGRRKGPGTAGSLANLAFFGGANGGGGTVDLDGPIDAERDLLSQHVDKILGGLL